MQSRYGGPAVFPRRMRTVVRTYTHGERTTSVVVNRIIRSHATGLPTQKRAPFLHALVHTRHTPPRCRLRRLVDLCYTKCRWSNEGCLAGINIKCMQIYLAFARYTHTHTHTIRISFARNTECENESHVCFNRPD